VCVCVCVCVCVWGVFNWFGIRLGGVCSEHVGEIPAFIKAVNVLTS
jgi:hypothetical protein